MKGGKDAGWGSLMPVAPHHLFPAVVSALAARCDETLADLLRVFS